MRKNVRKLAIKKIYKNLQKVGTTEAIKFTETRQDGKVSIEYHNCYPKSIKGL